VKKYFDFVVKWKKQLILFLIILVAGSSLNNLFSQNILAKPSRQSAMEAFSTGNFEQAYGEFSQLLLIYSKDPLYKYYSGACLVKLNRNPAEAESLLNDALQSAAAVRTLPSDAIFYLGRAQQMGGKFTEAINSYNLFTEQVGKKVSKELNVPDFVQQCNEKKGKVTFSELVPAVAVKDEKKQVDKIETQIVSKETNLKPVETDKSVNKNLPEGYEKILDDALEFQIKADSLYAIAAEQKKQLEKLPPAEKNTLRAKITETETAAATYQKSADQKYSEAQAAMNPQQVQSDVKVEVEKQPENKTSIQNSKQPDNKAFKTIDNKVDTSGRVAPVINKPVEIFSVFEVLPKPVKDPKEKIKIDPQVPEGLIYRIQVAVFRNLVAPSYFQGITPVYGFKVSGSDKTNYYVGMFRRSADAAKALSAVKSKGFKDSFVVPLSANKPVSADRAAILEKEWGKKPLMTLTNSGSPTPIDTLPPTLAFRVQVIRSAKPVKDDVIEGMRKMAGSRGLDFQSADDGNFIYLIGKFITFESAAEYADLLLRNGYRDAKVVAWLGKKEIPVETARQLFDNLK
jgi:tetratricopeptide (TPR) repeat protein